MNLLAILLTAILFALKLTSVLAIGWLVVFSPILVLIGVQLGIVILAVFAAALAAT